MGHADHISVDRHAFYQAGSIHGGVHFHEPQDDYRVGDDPIIATVERRPENPGHSVNSVTVTVDADPPMEMTRSGVILSVLLEARTTRAVTLRAMRVVVVDRRSPRPACLEAPHIGGPVKPRPFSADFDTDPPTLTALDVDFPFTISATDVEQFDIRPKASTHEIAWFLEIDWTCLGHRGTTVVDDGGKPFEIYPTPALFNSPALNWGCSSMEGHLPGCPTERLVALRRAGAVTVPETGLAKPELEAEFPGWVVWRSDAGRWYATRRGPDGHGTLAADSPNGLRIQLHQQRTGWHKPRGR